MFSPKTVQTNLSARAGAAGPQGCGPPGSFALCVLTRVEAAGRVEVKQFEVRNPHVAPDGFRINNGQHEFKFEIGKKLETKEKSFHFASVFLDLRWVYFRLVGSLC